MRSSLLLKLTAPVLVLTVVGLSISTFIGYHKSSAAIQSLVHAQQGVAVESVSRNFNLWASSRQTEVSGWAEYGIYKKSFREGVLGNSARKAANDRLKQLKVISSMYTAVMLVDLNGNIIASSADEEQHDTLFFPKTAGLERALQGVASVAHGLRDEKTATPVSAFYSPVLSDNKETIGAFVAIADLRTFSQDFVKPLKTGNSGLVEVFNQSGQVFLSTGYAEDFTRNVSSLGILGKLSGTTGTTTFEENGNQRLATFLVMENPPWTVLISAHKKEVLASARETSYISIITAFVIAIALGCGVYLLVRTMLRPIIATVDNLRDLSQGSGDLTQRLTISSNDEIGELGIYFNQFVDKLHGIIGRIKGVTESVANYSDSLSSITEESNNSLTRQRREVEMIAYAVSEMSVAAKDVAKNAAEAAGFAEKVDSEATSGSEVVNRTIESINGLASEVESSAQVIAALRTESQNVGSVLDVIKGIAEQTNLLALNAAIEAARAGELGRGFAVVADEVRVLAQRTQESTQEIEQIIEALQNKASQTFERIEDSRAQAQHTVKHAQEAGEALKRITSAVENILAMNQQIATSAEEQSTVTGEITQNVNNIQNLTNAVAETGDRTANSSKELKEFSSNLKEIVSIFKI